jgi:hypothetical protein
MKIATTLMWVLALGMAAAPVVPVAGAVQAGDSARIAFYVA